MTLSGYTVPISDRRIETQGGSLRIPLLPLPGASLEKWETTFAGGISLQDYTAGVPINFAIPLTRGRITAIVMTVDPANTYSALPSSMPGIGLLGPTGASVAATGGTDTSANDTAYEAEHTITLTVTGSAELSTGPHFVRFTPESTLDGKNNFLIKSIVLTIAPELEST